MQPSYETLLCPLLFPPSQTCKSVLGGGGTAGWCWQIFRQSGSKQPRKKSASFKGLWGRMGRRCRLINREVAGSEGQHSPSLLLLLSPHPFFAPFQALMNSWWQQSHWSILPPPSLPPSIPPLSCPPVLPPPPSLLAELHPHWLLLLTVC